MIEPRGSSAFKNNNSKIKFQYSKGASIDTEKDWLEKSEHTLTAKNKVLNTAEKLIKMKA